MKGSRRPNKNFNFIPPVSPPQLYLFGQIKNRYPDARLNFPIQTDKTTRYADIAIFSNGLDKTHFKICVEYDGKWHKYRRKQDHERDLELKRSGWLTIRINKKNLNDVFTLIEEAIKSYQ